MKKNTLIYCKDCCREFLIDTDQLRRTTHKIHLYLVPDSYKSTLFDGMGIQITCPYCRGSGLQAEDSNIPIVSNLERRSNMQIQHLLNNGGCNVIG